MALLALVLVSCVEELDLTESALPVPVRVDLVSVMGEELEVTARDVPIHRLRMSILDVGSGEELAGGDIELDPDSLPDRVRFRRDVDPGWEVVLEGTMELVRLWEGEDEEGGEGEGPVGSVEWAAVLEPVSISAEEETWEVEVRFGRGGLEDQAVAVVSVVPPEGPLLEGEAISLSASTEGGPEGGRVFWGSTDPEILAVSGDGTVTGLLPGSASVIAASGRAWASVEVQVLQRVEAVAVEPAEATLTGFGEEVTFQATPLDPREEAVPDRDWDVEWEIDDPEVAAHLGDGRFQALAPGEATVTATVEGVSGTASLVVDYQRGGTFEGDLTILDQGDVDLFAAAGWEEVDGNLTIGGPESPLVDLEGMETLVRVTGRVEIRGSPALLDVSALAALEEVGGAFEIAHNEILAALPEFAVLVSSGLQADGGGDLSIRGNPALEAIGGFPGLLEVAGNLQVDTNAVLVEVPGFPALSSVGGSLLVGGNPTLESVGAFPLLSEVGGVFWIAGNEGLTEVAGFPALASVGGLFRIGANPSLTGVGPFPELASVGTFVQFLDNDALGALPELSALASIGGNLVIQRNASIQDLDPLTGVTATIQDLLIDENAALADIQGLGSLGAADGSEPAVEGDFTVTDNPNLPTSQAQELADLLGVGGTVTIEGNLEDEAEPARIEWVGEGGDWNDPSNWSLERVPMPGDTVELMADGTYTVTIGSDAVEVGALLAGPDTGTVTLALEGTPLTLSEWLDLRSTAVLSVADEAMVVTPDLRNSGTISADGTLSVMRPAGPVDAVNEAGGRIEVGPEGVMQFLLGGGALANRGVIEGTGAGAALVLQSGTVTLEEGGEVLGTGLLAAVGVTLNLEAPLPAEDWQLFLSQSEVNGPEPILVPEGAEWSWTDATVNTFVENRGGLVLLGVNALNAGLVHAPGAMVDLVAMPDREETSLTVTESDGFFIEGGVRLYDPFPGEDRVLRLSVPQGSLVVDEEGVIEVLATTGTTVAEVRGDLTNRGRIVVEAPVVMGSDEGWHRNAGLIEILADGILAFAGERFDNTTQGDLVGEIRGEGVLEVGGVEFTNSALISPGLSPGILTLEGDLIQDEGSAVGIGLAGTEPGSGYDRLVVTGEAVLDGTLVVQLEDGFTPSLGDQFTVLTWGSRASEFSGTFLPALSDGLEWDLAYGANALTLSVTAPTEPARLAGGNAHTCAIDDVGTIHCWGLNNGGQLGDGTTTPRSEAAPVLGGLTYAEVTASISGACGLTTDGAAYCWGGNLFGVLGTGGDGGEVQPTRVSTNATYTRISAYVHHACGLVQGGGTECWGRNDFGQLGDGGTADSNAPVPVVGAPTFREISTGTNHTCALDGDGLAYCWGRNEAGELGDGTNQQRTAPTPVAGGIRFRTISAGNGYTCALDLGALAHCWGSGLTEPTLQPGDVRFRTFSSGTNFRCGTDVDGNAHCWGSNGGGQLGDGTTTARSEPVPVAGGLLFEEVRASGPNAAHGCGRTGSGEVHCWGSDGSGQLGTGRLLWTADPVAVPEVPDFVEVTLGGQHACGLTDTGAAWCWGTNSQGQLGNGSTTTPVLPVQVAGGIAFDALEAGLNHTCGLSDGEMYCWGSNFVGQLGDGTTTQRPNPTPVAGNLRFDAMGIGWNHSCGLADFTAYCWGSNQGGELGDGTQTQRDSPTPVDTELIFFDITAGSSFTCALAEDDGTGYCWGFGTSGRLGTGSGSNQLRPAQLSTDPAFERIIAGSQHACALTIFNLTPYCWGLNTSGQIGDGTTTTRFEPVPIGDGLSFTDMALSGVTTCGVDGQGTVHCWGDNATGAVGDGTTTQRLTPTRVSGGVLAAGIGRATGGSATDTSFLVVGPDGTTWGWGSNLHHRVFPGDPIQSEVPVRALFP